ncbi:NADPH:quinone reductase and related Zn-dependent oxidoreductase [Amycolatopsis mediterranei S699]|uniref:NADPH:quinone reductase and related Zn-dependent oxidoreductase n=2 Tax=Amycolatopsis mediterranei TaxID=33910 RepID=A0A0H3D505_AMYMU|nr:zinc-binding alcohol dehydrogenase family protein [Amycolatopsis mediterranei]ADJ45332.1 NADPH:quinone reductase and related Zn-dependent oxidoreductase [Amycolatopsis mediterranei U32]AEK42092.1 NADPH:quinone reductase and related Zn-dependent oxidoreductase [Amycolatopsis mediterranei S699]AFO77043.1 NADPH:quinone reductase and related Zn-dependent oxidoreductase [Amycolatopsis mediterranei S699]AGT84171.1 NADPH:quinone reductase-related Zn-dependent oxidoreductase [Amycolatopsis mediterra
MRAIQYDEFGGYDVLRVVDVPVPVPDDGQALVRVTLAGVNPLDDTVRSGKLPAAAVRPLPIRPGGFGVGVLTEPGASGLPAGTRVILSGGRYGVGADGAWAEYIAVDPRHVVPIPDAVDDTAAAALTAATGHLTAYLALSELAGFRPGQSVLAPGVAGGVGQGGVDVARVLGAGAAITTATSTAKAERGRAAGFEVIDLSTESLRDGVHRLTGGKGVDVVLDGVGGSVTGAALGALAVDGTLVSVGYAASTRTEIDVTDLIWKNTHIHGFRFALFTPEQINAANTHLLDLLARKEITPLVDRVFPLEQAAQAQRHLAEGSPFGRVLLTI